MTVVRLSDLRSLGLTLTAHEGVAVVHEVCRLMQEAGQHGRHIRAPRVGELFVAESGELIIEPTHPDGPGYSDSLSDLIDELMPAHFDDQPPSHQGDPWSLNQDLSGDPERMVLRALFQRVSAVMSRASAPAPAPKAAAVSPPPPAPAADPLPEPERELVFEPMLSAEHAPAEPRRPWVRRLVLWGLAVDAALAVVIAVRIGLVPLDVWPFQVWPAEAGSSGAPIALAPEGVQQVPSASAPETPERIEAPAMVEAEPEAVSLARRGTLISARAPQRIVVPSVVEGADSVSPSPDGQHVAFDLDRDNVRGVFIADRDGGNVVLASGEGRASSPSWSPAGSHLAFARAEADRPSVWNLWVREMRSGALQRLTDYPAGMVRGASWFPDGRRICYAHQRTLIIQDIESGRIRSYAAPAGTGLIRAPSVSPDGAHVAFEIESSGIWMLDVNRQAMEQIIDDPTPSALAWRGGDEGLTYFSVGSRQWRAWRPSPSS